MAAIPERPELIIQYSVRRARMRMHHFFNPIRLHLPIWGCAEQPPHASEGAEDRPDHCGSHCHPRPHCDHLTNVAGEWHPARPTSFVVYLGSGPGHSNRGGLIRGLIPPIYAPRLPVPHPLPLGPCARRWSPGSLPASYCPSGVRRGGPGACGERSPPDPREGLQRPPPAGPEPPAPDRRGRGHAARHAAPASGCRLPPLPRSPPRRPCGLRLSPP